MAVPVSSSRETVRAGVGVLAIGASIAMLYYGRVFFITIIIAAMIAFLLDPMVVLFMRMRLPRGFASFAVCSMGLVFLYFAGLGLYTESLSIISDLPAYSDRINELVDNAADRFEHFESGIYRTLIPKRFQEQAPPPIEPPAASRGKKRTPIQPAPAPQQPPPLQEVRVHQEPASVFTAVSNYLSSFYDIALMASFVPFLVYFLLSWRDHLRNRFLLMFEGEDRDSAELAWAGVGEMVRAYVIGNFLLGLLLSLASAILFASVKLPYWLVVAPLSGFLSLVPYVGLPLAMLPPMFAALPMHAKPSVYLFLVAAVALLHLFALNLLYPKFVGARVHLNPLAVTVALMFWGLLWGGIGLLLAIPMTAAIKAICDNVGELRAYGRLLGDS